MASGLKFLRRGQPPTSAEPAPTDDLPPAAQWLVVLGFTRENLPLPLLETLVKNPESMTEKVSPRSDLYNAYLG